MNVSIISQSTSDINAGLFGYISSYGTVSNLIVVGTVTVNGGGKCRAGGICAWLGGTIEFCRFNGTVSSTTTGSDKLNYAGGITGTHVGALRKITGCIANAKVTVNGGKADESAAGGLAGSFYGSDCKYSAWNNASNEGTSNMIGKNADTNSSTGTGNNSFTNISELNALLSGINTGVPNSTYIWQAGDGGTDYPKLVQRTPAGN
ncbi:hypothetical protein [Parabacteroides provencensis]|uniref:hypothetical protein n=1 Tax=Parabacteroides provencensis TaxID=1944636 RepID=UPI000C157016|nr:hypothetical protein [Parabacteroides provencensis]